MYILLYYTSQLCSADAASCLCRHFFDAATPMTPGKEHGRQGVSMRVQCMHHKLLLRW
jgi:hypothetical protein